MNIEEIKKELEYHASLARFGELDVKRVQKLFDLLMNHGIYYEEFVEIEHPRSVEFRDFLPNFEAALKRLDIVIPKNKNPSALWYIVRYHMENIVKQIFDPEKELYGVLKYAYFECWNSKFLEILGIDIFYDMYFEFEMGDHMSWNGKFGEEAKMAIKEDLIKEAKKWIENHPDELIQERIKNTPLRIFITGANGFIGSYITAKLLKEGHEVICAVRDVEATRLKFLSVEIVHFDFNDISIQNLSNHLNDVDIVINVAGVLQSSAKNKIDKVHNEGPKILFDQCIKAGVQRIIHISALGIDDENSTDYALTKREADNYLKTLENIDWVILQPSLIYASGCFGGTSLFRGLATLPYFIPLVGDGEQKFQPIHIDDLTEVVSFIVKKDDKIQKVIKVVGPDVVTVKEILVKFRSWLGVKPAKFMLKIPNIFVKAAAKIGDLFGSDLLNSTLYKMMQIPNIADQKDLIESTGIKPRSFKEGLETEPLTIQSLWHARLYLFKPCLKIILAMFWILSGIIPSIIAPEIALDSIKSLRFDGIFSKTILYFSSSLDILLGLMLLFSKKTSKVCLLQIALIVSYTLVLGFLKPDLWLEPFGLLLKNIPIIMLTLVLIIIDRDK